MTTKAVVLLLGKNVQLFEPSIDVFMSAVDPFPSSLLQKEKIVYGDLTLCSAVLTN